MLLLINNSTNGNVLSFIFQVRKALKEQNIPYIERNKIDESIILMKDKIKGIILSGSPMMLRENILQDYVADIYYISHLNVPVLGICFGCQLLTVLNGGSLESRGKLFCETTPIEYAPGHMLFKNLPADPELKFCFNDLPVAPKKSKIVKEIAWIDVAIGKENVKRDKISRHAIAFQFSPTMFAILGHPELHQYSWPIYKNFANFCKV